MITSYTSDNILTIIIHDNGTGVPEHLRQDIFKPFFKIDSQRSINQNASTGLGLALTQDIIQRHGGTIYAEQSDILGGLKITMTLMFKSEL